MAGEWKDTSLAEVSDDVAYGYTESASAERVGPRFLRITDIQNGVVDWHTVPFCPISEADHQRYRLYSGDIVVARTGNSTGENYLFQGAEDAVYASYLIRFRVNQRVADPAFVWYCMRTQSWQAFINSSKTGSAQAGANAKVLGRFQLALPPLAQQKAIAAVLGALDDKIELNRRMNATLEAMARALFQSWFVDFDPVRAKLDGRQPIGLDETTATLFPDSFQDSAVGHIPNGWRVGVLDELTKFVIGGDWGATEPTDDETVSCYCIRGADIPSLQSGGVGKMPTRFLKPSSVEKRQLADGDVAIEISGGSPTQCTGRPVLASDALLQSLGQPLVASNFCRILKLKSPALSKFVYLWLRQLYDLGELFQFETGTTGIKNFAFVIFSERYPLVVPDLRVAEAFDRALSPFFVRIQANSKQSRTLATLRDTLLPKLLSGELSVI